MENWENMISCATACGRCDKKMKPEDPRILSVYDHQAICEACKKEEEQRPDYAEISRNTIGECMDTTELQYNDPNGFCFHHFYPYKCDAKITD
jgi:hypothetical protein